MKKPSLNELKVGMHIWLLALLVGKNEGWSYTYTYKKKWARGTITNITNGLITISEDDWNYIYNIDYYTDIFGEDWNVFGGKKQ